MRLSLSSESFGTVGLFVGPNLGATGSPAREALSRSMPASIAYPEQREYAPEAPIHRKPFEMGGWGKLVHRAELRIGFSGRFLREKQIGEIAGRRRYKLGANLLFCGN